MHRCEGFASRPGATYGPASEAERIPHESPLARRPRADVLGAPFSRATSSAARGPRPSRTDRPARAREHEAHALLRRRPRLRESSLARLHPDERGHGRRGQEREAGGGGPVGADVPLGRRRRDEVRRALGQREVPAAHREPPGEPDQRRPEEAHARRRQRLQELIVEHDCPDVGQRPPPT